MIKQTKVEYSVAYIVSPCAMAAAGLKELISNQGVATEVILLNDASVDTTHSEDDDVIDTSGLYVFYIPKESFYFLLMLIYIAERIKKFIQILISFSLVVCRVPGFIKIYCKWLVGKNLFLVRRLSPQN